VCHPHKRLRITTPPATVWMGSPVDVVDAPARASRSLGARSSPPAAGRPLGGRYVHRRTCRTAGLRPRRPLCPQLPRARTDGRPGSTLHGRGPKRPSARRSPFVQHPVVHAEPVTDRDWVSGPWARAPVRGALRVPRCQRRRPQRHGCEHAVARYVTLGVAARVTRTLLASPPEQRSRSPDPRRARRGAGRA